MRLSKHRRKTSAAMDMTPMIDITFQLMIFFMTCTQISQVNKEKEVELPQLKEQGSTEQQENVTITINVNESGEIKVSGRQMTVTELIASVGDELAAVENEPTRIHVVLRADRRGNSRTVNEVVTALAKLNIHHVRIAVVASEG